MFSRLLNGRKLPSPHIFPAQHFNILRIDQQLDGEDGTYYAAL